MTTEICDHPAADYVIQSTSMEAMEEGGDSTPYDPTKGRDDRTLHVLRSTKGKAIDHTKSQYTSRKSMYEVINAQYPGEHDIRGVKDGLKRGRNKDSYGIPFAVRTYGRSSRLPYM